MATVRGLMLAIALLVLAVGPARAADLGSATAGGGETFEIAGAAGTSFVDDFANLSAWQIRSGGGTVSSGTLTTSSTTADDQFVIESSDSYGDVTLEAAVSDEDKRAEHRTGLMVRFSVDGSGRQSYYFAYLNNGNVGLDKVVAGTTTNIGGLQSVGYSGSTFYWLKVVATGSSIAVFYAPSNVDGSAGAYVQKLAVTDATLSAGKVGLLNDNGQQKSRARFRAPRVTTILPQDWSAIVQASGRPGLIWDRTSGSAHGGNGSLQLFSGDSSFYGYSAQSIAGSALTCRVCTVTGWTRTTGVSNGAGMLLVEQPSGTSTILGSQSGTAGWAQFSTTVSLRADTVSVELRAAMLGSGVARFDDVALGPAPPTPTPTSTPTRTPTPAPTHTPDWAATLSPFATYSPFATFFPTATPTTTRTPTPTVTVTPTPGPCQSMSQPSGVSLPIQLTGDDAVSLGTLGSIPVTSNCGAGWHLDAATTQFSAGSRTIPVDAMQVTGVDVLVNSGAGPTNSVAYPITLMAGGSSVRIFNVASGSGIGSFVLTPKVNLRVPAATYAGNYAATITFTLASGP